MNMNKTKGITQEEICWSLRFYVALIPYMGGHEPARNHYYKMSTFFEHFPKTNNSLKIVEDIIHFPN